MVPSLTHFHKSKRRFCGKTASVFRISTTGALRCLRCLRPTATATLYLKATRPRNCCDGYTLPHHHPHVRHLKLKLCPVVKDYGGSCTFVCSCRRCCQTVRGATIVVCNCAGGGVGRNEVRRSAVLTSTHAQQMQRSVFIRTMRHVLECQQARSVTLVPTRFWRSSHRISVSTSIEE